MDNERNESGNVAESRKEVRIYTGAGGLSIEVLVESDRFWLNRQQLAKLFGRDVKTIGKHIANALKEELKDVPTVAKFATVQFEGGRRVVRMVEHYDIDMILSVGYRVKSSEGIRFRKWASAILKAQILRNAQDNRLLQELEKRFSDHEFRLSDVEKALQYVVGTLMPSLPSTDRIGFRE